MKLELGKTYITANGREMTVLDLNFDGSDRPVLCKGKNYHGEMTIHSFTIDGISLLTTDLDIVKEKPKTVKVYVLRYESGMFAGKHYNPVENVKDAYLFSESAVNGVNCGYDREFILIGEIPCDL